MKFCIYGAGAIGGYLGFMLSEAGFDVTLIDHGAHFKAIRDSGLTLHLNGEARTISIPCTDNPASLPPQDYVFIAVKTYAVAEILEHLPGLLHAETAVVNVNNGIPWWYFYGEQGEPERAYLESVDPGGQQWQRIGPERAIGCVVYPACQLIAPGVIEHISGNSGSRVRSPMKQLVIYGAWYFGRVVIHPARKKRLNTLTGKRIVCGKNLPAHSRAKS